MPVKYSKTFEVLSELENISANEDTKNLSTMFDRLGSL